MSERGFELVGVALAGPSPVGIVYLPWPRRVGVLYGLNGAGKTQLLRALAAVLRGETEGDGYVFIRVDPSAGEEAPIFEPLLEAVGSFAGEDVMGAEVLWEAAGEADTIEELIRLMALRGVPWKTAVDSDIIEPSLLALRPAQTGRPAGFDVYVCHTRRVAGMGEDLSSVEEDTGTTDGDRLESWLADAPAWVPRPHIKIGTAFDFHIGILGDDQSESIDPAPLLERLHKLASAVDTDPDGGVDAGDLVEQVAVKLSGRVNRWLDLLIPGTPPIGISMPGSGEGVYSARWTISVVDPISDSPSVLPLEALSRSQRRWAEIAISWEQVRLFAPYHFMGELNIVFPQTTDTHVIAVLDEPESGLHSQAVKDLSNGLGRLAGEGTAFVATHAHQLLTNPDFDLIHVRRDTTGFVTAESVPVGSMSVDPRLAAASFGVSPAELLVGCKVAVLVEGEHDEVVLQAVLGGTLAERGGLLFSMSGARRVVNAAEAAILLDYTDAEIVVVLDNIRAQSFQEVWSECLAGALTNPWGASQRMLQWQGSPHEEKLLRSLAVRALRTGSWHRVHPYGLSEPDIIRYLPPDTFVDGVSEWSELDQRFKAEGRPYSEFKSWVGSKGRNVTTKRVAAAARVLDVIHDDFVELDRLIRQVSGEPGEDLVT